MRHRFAVSARPRLITRLTSKIKARKNEDYQSWKFNHQLSLGGKTGDERHIDHHHQRGTARSEFSFLFLNLFSLSPNQVVLLLCFLTD